MADTWIMDVTMMSGAQYRVLCQHVVRDTADLESLKAAAADLLDGPAVLLRQADVAGGAEHEFVLLRPGGIQHIDLRLHEQAPDPLRMLWALEPVPSRTN